MAETEECDVIVLKVGPEPTCTEGESMNLVTENELQKQLEAFVMESQNLTLEKHKPKPRVKKIYYQIGMIAFIDIETTDTELMRLLRNDIRTLLVSLKTNTPNDLEQIILKINTGIYSFSSEQRYVPVGIAIEIHGEQLTTGRMRNYASADLEINEHLVLTTNLEYKYICFKEIIYVTNLWKYIPFIQLYDVISLGRLGSEVAGKVLKILNHHITIEILQPGRLSSYENVKIPLQCYDRYMQNKSAHEISELDKADIKTALKMKASFLVIKGIRNKFYTESISRYLSDLKVSLKIIITLDLQFSSDRVLELVGVLKSIDLLWIPEFDKTTNNSKIKNYITHVVGVANSIRCPIILSIPLRKCRDFVRWENHTILKAIDAMVIEKSSFRKKYPIIAKKLQPLKFSEINRKCEISEIPGMRQACCKKGIVKFIEKTICSIFCRAIIINSKCPSGPLALATKAIYCPVIVVLASEDEGNDIEIATMFNLRRNLKSILYPSEIRDQCKLTPINFGIAYGRSHAMVETGDFIITLDAVDDGSNSDSFSVVNMRSFYLPPPKC